MKTLSLEETNRLLDEAVAEKGADFVYVPPGYTLADVGNIDASECKYVHGNQCGCLVGEVFHRAGASLQSLHRVEGLAPSEPELQNRIGVQVDAVTGELLCAVQAKQDSGAPWGEAVRLARLEHGL